MHELHEVRFRHPVRDADPPCARGSRRLHGEDLDHWHVAIGEERGLGATDQPAAEDNSQIGGNLAGLGVVERTRSHVDLVSCLLEQLCERRLSCREDKDTRSGIGHGGMIPSFAAFEACDPGKRRDMRPKTLDHVALWVADRDRISDFATRYLGMHVIETTEKFTLVGADARRGKLTLFAAEGSRERGALKHVALRVRDLSSVAPELVERAEREDGGLYVDVAEGLRIGIVEAGTDLDYDLDHVALYATDPGVTSHGYEALGFSPAGAGPSGCPRVEVGGAWVEFHRGEPGDPERPLLNHLAVLVDSTDEHIAAANELGIEIADVVDAENTYAVFLWGPDRVKVEYVEHKPSFSLV